MHQIYTITALICIIACSSKSASDLQSEQQLAHNEVLSTMDSSNNNSQNKDTLIKLDFEGNSIECHVHYPQSEIKGAILLLHGWNFPALDWCENTSFCKLAKDSGFVLIMPFFGKSTYHWETYPETIEAYRKYPNRKWMYESFLPRLQDFNLLKEGGNNYVAGISTGGRGAALFALEQAEIFKAGACLSADFDHSLLVDEPINNGFYGSIKEHPERWTGLDNIHNRAEEMEVPLYLGHGTKDKVCSHSQTKAFAEELKKLGKEYKLNLAPYEHNYEYWESESQTILSYFLNHLN